MRNDTMEHGPMASGDRQRGMEECDARLVMKTRERQVNDALRGLDEDHRLHGLARDDYRQRRRVLLESLGDEIAQAERDTVRRMVPAYDTSTSSEMRKACDGHAQRKRNRTGTRFDAVALMTRVALFGAVALCIVVMLCYCLAGT
jgi:hypothetical protein